MGDRRPLRGYELLMVRRLVLAFVAVLVLTANQCDPESVLNHDKRRCTKENRWDRGDDCKVNW